MATLKGNKKIKLIDKLVGDQIATSRDVAEKQIRAGLIRVDGEIVDKPGTLVSAQAAIAVTQRKDFVGRGALKLVGALDAFNLSPDGMICADVGACTGGFTEVLLLRGAMKVYAIDVGYGDLDWKIRTNPRVVVMERTNVRYVESLPDPIALVTIDVSFISLDKVLPVISKWLVPGGTIVALVKPQFEASPDEVGDGGIISDPAVHDRVIEKVTALLPALGLERRGLIPSPILGTEGNKEFLLWASKI